MRYLNILTFLLFENHAPTWLEVAASIPAAVMLWAILWWTPKGRRQWFLAAAMIAYLACYYLIFVRHR